MLLFGKYSHKSDLVYLLIFGCIIFIAFVIIQFQVNILADPTLPVLIVVLVLMIYFRWKAIEKRPYFAVTTDRVLSYGYVKIIELATKKSDFEFSVKEESAKVKLKENSLKFTVLKDQQSTTQSS